MLVRRRAGFAASLVVSVMALAAFAAPGRPQPRRQSLGGAADPAEVTIGERLFLETRFAQFFYRNAAGVNVPLETGDPALATLPNPSGLTAGPFAGKSINCRNCHLVDDSPAGTRTYADFGRRSRVPTRDDGASTTPRNSPPMVNAFLPRDGFLLHWDGEFATTEALIRATFTGRNFGWRPGERDVAVHHLARVIREDDGRDGLGRQYGGAYRIVLAGTDASLPDELILPEAYRLDVLRATDEEVFEAVVRLVTAYLRSLTFAQDDAGDWNGSPYDAFLRKNGLPLRPDELKGLKVFLREPPDEGSPAARNPVRRTGNCLTCHAPPLFTDFRFHNTGAAQEEYDSVHGSDAFRRLLVPDHATRAASPDAFLPATAEHPRAADRFRSVPSKDRVGWADLGLWNVFANPDFPEPQAAIRTALGVDGSDAALLPRTLALFKTPSLRDLGQSAPYLHTGRMREIEEVLDFYAAFSAMARDGRVRNADSELQRVFLGENDIDPVAAFLRSLNEDYN
jgi:cytochrome c peroxidase